MGLKVESTLLLDRLKEMSSTASVDPFTVQLMVPNELFWWIYLEYGTATRSDFPSAGYEIVPVHTNFLRFFDTRTNSWRKEDRVFMPGIPAFHMITSIYDDIVLYERQFITDIVQQSNYDFQVVKEAIYTEMMPKIKDMIVASFQDNLPNHLRPYGRLDMTAAQAFEEGLEIV